MFINLFVYLLVVDFIEERNGRKIVEVGFFGCIRSFIVVICELVWVIVKRYAFYRWI